MNVVVPTGNFGNILASYYAKQMGIPIGKFVCASNKNKYYLTSLRQENTIATENSMLQHLHLWIF